MEDYRFTPEHPWGRKEGGGDYAGITDFAQQHLKVVGMHIELWT